MNALGDGDEMRLAPAFRAALATELELEIPQNSFVAMDYHFDWIFAALADVPFGPGQIPNPERGKDADGKPRRPIRGNQEDIDLLIAFEDRHARTHLVLVEAKGVTPWSNSQWKSKVGRLNDIFVTEDLYPGVVPHLVLASRNGQKNLDLGFVPKHVDWCSREGGMHEVKVEIPKQLFRVERCDAGGSSTPDGDYWQFKPGS